MSQNNYTSVFSTNKVTPQNQPVLGKKQVKNNAGGYVFELSHWKQLERFLLIGTVGGTYYVGQQKLTLENAKLVVDLVNADGKRVVDTIVSISDAGRAPSNEQAVFALAICAGLGSDDVRKYALSKLDKVCRIGTDLFHFATYIEQHRGWGAGLRKAVANWYESKDNQSLQFQLIKYRQRDGWSHRDLVRLSHPKKSPLMKWVSGKDGIFSLVYNKSLDKETPLFTANEINAFETEYPLVYAFEQARTEANEKELIRLITQNRLPVEAIPTEKLSNAVWEALLLNMGLTGILRNLGQLSGKGILTNQSEMTKFVVSRLTDSDGLKKARIHPFKLLAAMYQYKQGHGARGSNSWSVIQRIMDGLDEGYYLSFGNVTSTNARIMEALDVSGSMGMGVNVGLGMTARDVSAAMAMITLRTEPNTDIFGFSDKFISLPIGKRQRLDDVINTVSGLPFGRTDCALPMLYALKNKLKYDAFVIYTDNETWFGNIHPFQALKAYRQEMGIDAKLIVVGITATGFSIADPSDAGSLDIAGFDSATPQFIADFIGNK